MSIHRFDKLFSDEELELLQRAIHSSPKSEIREQLGRLEISGYELPQQITDKLGKIISGLSDIELTCSKLVLYVEYNKKYGHPDLPPHFDADRNEFIIDYQLESNTSWDLGINMDVYDMKDNSALIFNPNLNIHWRPVKHFEDGEYVRMVFFRFYNASDPSDYSHMGYSQEHEIYSDVINFRNSLAIQYDNR